MYKTGYDFYNNLVIGYGTEQAEEIAIEYLDMQIKNKNKSEFNFCCELYNAIQNRKQVKRYKVIQLFENSSIKKAVCNTADYIQALNICKAYKNSYIISTDNDIPYKNIDIPFSVYQAKKDGFNGII